MKQVKKNKWSKPELAVMVRNKPEEAVLTVCKNGIGGGPDNEYSWCSPYGDCMGVCSGICTS